MTQARMLKIFRGSRGAAAGDAHQWQEHRHHPAGTPHTRDAQPDELCAASANADHIIVGFQDPAQMPARPDADHTAHV